MNPTAIYSKSGKGVQEAAGKTSLLTRPDRAVLSAIDGRATLAEVAQKVGKTFDLAFQQLVAQLDKNGFVREVSPGGAAAAPKPAAAPPPKPAAVPPRPGASAPPKPAAKAEDSGADLDFSSLGTPSRPAPAPARPAAAPATPPPPKDTQSALTKAREEAEAKAQADRDRLKKEVEAKARAEMEAKLRAEAEAKAKSDAAAAADAKVKAAREAALKAAEAKVKAEQEGKARLEAERKAHEETERRLEAERKAKDEAERVRKETEERARREADELRKSLEAERKAREEAERNAKEEAERVRKELEAERKRLELERKREDEERAARRKREDEEEQARRRQKEEEERKAEEERAAKRKQREEEDAAREQEEQAKRESKKRQREEEDAAREQEEQAKREAKKRQREEEAAAREAQDEAEREAARAAKRKLREEEEAAAAAIAAAKPAPKAAAKSEPPKAEAPKVQAKTDSFADSLLADLDSFTDKDAEEAKAKDEADRKAKAAAEVRAREDADRQAKEEAEQREREEVEERRREEEARRAREEEQRHAQEEERRKREAEEIRRKAEAATAAAMAKEGKKVAPKGAEDDIPVTDDDLDMDEVNRETAQVAKGKPKEKEAKPEKKKKPVAAEAPPKIRRPMKLGKPIAITLALLLALGVGVAHVMPLDTADYERAATEAFGRPVKIGSAKLWLLTGLQVRFNDVRVGDARIAHVTGYPSAGSVFGDKKEFGKIELDGFTLPQEAIGDALFASVKSEGFTVEHITVKNLEVPGPATLPKSLQADIALDAKGAMKTVTVRGPDALVAKITPQDDGVIFELTAAGFTLPIAPQVTLSNFGMKGNATPRGMTITDWGGSLLGGAMTGNANVRWGSSWVVEGVVTVRNINAAVFAPALLSSGSGEGTARFSMNAPDPKGLVSAGRLDGNFTISKGTLGSIDLARAIQSGGKAYAGSTQFVEMNGQGTYDRGAVSLRNVTISAGALNAGASADISQSGALSGRIVADVKTTNRALSATLLLGGTVKEPQVRN